MNHEQEAQEIISKFAFIIGKHDKITSGFAYPENGIKTAKECALVYCQQLIDDYSEILTNTKGNKSMTNLLVEQQIADYKKVKQLIDTDYAS